jgi:hypothetical protein
VGSSFEKVSYCIQRAGKCVANGKQLPIYLETNFICVTEEQ